MDKDLSWCFQFAEKYLTEDLTLKYPNPEKPYTLFTDASKYAWACILTQVFTIT